jgi:hypothetical protein
MAYDKFLAECILQDSIHKGIDPGEKVKFYANTWARAGGCSYAFITPAIPHRIFFVFL